ncbi:hypothetical protein P9294_gp090 [Bacillus phage FADO]|uniref:Uncharacterized protein n=1 Tax=Bacillus phage FADO TaxID=2917160 RepID=A0AAE9K5S9_9CAUD|nr:hypothetical protein P9294_gp090 [Bacillus phage FADO]UNY48805.1 hypothetical protein fado_90 [Bacillus phage FADO]
MKNGDIIINLDNKLKVEFTGWIAGRVSSYKIIDENGWEKFDGTIEELLKHCHNKVKKHNEHVQQFGGTLI